jgi:2-hydroxychromene-2-carboxylate isomerase
MTKTVDYFLAPVSPWTYLGHERLREMCRRHGARINVRPCDLGGKIFPVSGGLPLKQRAPQRQAYRMAELKRWRAYLDIPLTLEPKYFPADGEPASRLIIAASRLSEDAAMALAGAALRACWAEERNIADADTLKAILEEQGFGAEAMLHHAASAETKAAYDAYTQEAIDKGVFGAPTYIVDGELFWGQDRLEFVERALARQ